MPHLGQRTLEETWSFGVWGSAPLGIPVSRPSLQILLERDARLYTTDWKILSCYSYYEDIPLHYIFLVLISLLWPFHSPKAKEALICSSLAFCAAKSEDKQFQKAWLLAEIRGKSEYSGLAKARICCRWNHEMLMLTGWYLKKRDSLL